MISFISFLQHRTKLLFVFTMTCFLSAVCMAQNPVYLFSYFKNNGKDGLHLAYSRDGYQWTALKNDQFFLKPVLSKDSLMRDPCIIRGADNKFHMVWTVSWNQRGIGYAASKDLINWEPQQYIPVMEQEDSARNCWAPEVTYDSKKKQYVIYWATTIKGKDPLADPTAESGYNHRMYYTTTKDFKKFTPTKLLYDKGFNVIDATIVKKGKRYLMFLKDETIKPIPQKNIRIATSNHLTKGFSQPSKPITGNYWAEGPTAVKIGKQWLLYFDKYREHKYGAIASADLVSWKDVSSEIKLPPGIRHGSIFMVTEAEFRGLLQKN